MADNRAGILDRASHNDLCRRSSFDQPLLVKVQGKVEKTWGLSARLVEPLRRGVRATIGTMIIKLSPEQRTARMRRIRKVDTKPELVVRRAAHALGFRFRLHRRDLPGSPDLVFPRHRKVVLVHGCFWHQHQGCSLVRQPKNNSAYWLPKLAGNVERDHRVQAELAALGWGILIIWECDTRKPDKIGDQLVGFLGTHRRE
jgi:DNA mismatch endonuclease (patch repair protein)